LIDPHGLYCNFLLLTAARLREASEAAWAKIDLKVSTGNFWHTAEIGANDPIFVGERGGKLQNWDRWLKLLSRKTGVSGWSAHTLRRTAATLAADLGTEPHVISVLLGPGQLRASCSKSRYRREHAEALQRLASTRGTLRIHKI
jgi:integrase